ARRNSRRSANEVSVDEYPIHVADEKARLPTDSYGDSEELRQAIQALPKGQRSAIELLKLREMSLKEAAQATGLSISALKVSVHRAIKTLRASLQGYPSTHQPRGDPRRGTTSAACPCGSIA